MKKDKRKETAATLFYSTLGQDPEETRMLSRGAAKVLSEEEKRREEERMRNNN
jgi:hypothetical protein